MSYPNDPAIVSAIAPSRSLLFLIDLEPNERTCFQGMRSWDGTVTTLRHLEIFRGHLENKTGRRATFNWFLRSDPQMQSVWGNLQRLMDAFPQIFRNVNDHGDYCGIHVHLWRWDGRRSMWYNELNEPQWTAECLGVSIEAYRRIFQRSPEACRFGDRWLNQYAVNLMQAHGILYDLTIEPGLRDESIFDDPQATGWLPDYHDAPRLPYQPCPGNFMTPRSGDAVQDSLWMLPLTTTPPAYRPVRRPPYLLRASRPMNLSLSHAHIWNHLRDQLGRQSRVPLIFVLRSGDFAVPHFSKNIFQTLEQLVQHPALAQCEFTNPAQAIERWRASQ